MIFIVWLLAIILVWALAFTIYYQVLLRVLHIDLNAREIHTITTPDGWRIRLFRYRKGGSSGEPVLLVHGYTSNHWNLTLPRGSSMADFLVEKGYDCWAIDLRGNRTSVPPPGKERHSATYDGYVMQDLPAAIAFIRQSTGYDQVHWVGHSMGGMLLYAYELAHGRDQIASGSTIGSPPWLDTHWTRAEDRMVWFLKSAPRLFEVFKRAPAPLFMYLKPDYPHVPIRWENLSPKFSTADLFNAIGQSPIPVTRTFEEYAKHRYLAVDNDRVNVFQGLSRLQTPLLVMAAPRDPIAPVTNLKTFFDRLPSDDKRFVELSKAEGCEMDHSHVEPPFSKNAPTEVFAPIAQWIAAHPAAMGTPVVSPVPVAELPVETPMHVETPEPVAVTSEQLAQEIVVAETVVAAVVESGETSWGRALQSAASILSGLGEPSAAVVTNGKAPKASAKKPRKVKTTKKKSSTKSKSSTKTRRAAAASAKVVKPAATSHSPSSARGKKTAKPSKAANANGDDAASAKPVRRSTKAKSARKRSTKQR